ncbi:MAG: hypothetical protein EOP07_03405 [Proteobacteria bacterium]|nr:MAG: hypothetical protein EOP07_03405 [Pseudomonadota bacterium]
MSKFVLRIEVSCLAFAFLLSCKSSSNPSVIQAETPKAEVTLLEKDLAIILPKTSPIAFENDGVKLFEEDWLKQIQKNYAELQRQGSLFRTAFSSDSPWDQWRLISMRIAVCEPLGRAEFHDPDRYCWPQIRLIWQPVRKGIAFNLGPVPQTVDADDQAIHQVFLVDPSLVLKAEDVGKVFTYLGGARVAAEGTEAKVFAETMANGLKELSSLQTPVVEALMRDALALRDPSRPSSDYQGFGLRPEFGGTGEAGFIQRLKGFLSKYSKVASTRSIATLAIPSGGGASERQAWAMAGFQVVNNHLQPVPLDVYDSVDNHMIAKAARFITPGANTQVTIGSGLEDMFLEPGASTPGLKAETRQALERVMIERDKFTRKAADDPSKVLLTAKLLDVNKTRVLNTSCFSCHQLKEDTNDFHNLGYFERKELSVSPRVVKEVERDLRWLKSRGL